MNQREVREHQANTLLKIQENKKYLACLNSKRLMMAKDIKLMGNFIGQEETEEDMFKYDPKPDFDWKDKWPSVKEIEALLCKIKETKDELKTLTLQAHSMGISSKSTDYDGYEHQKYY